MHASLGEAVPLQLLLADGRTDLFVQVKLYDKDGVLVDTLPVPHIQNGIYTTSFIFLSEGYFSAVFNIFLDAGFSSPSLYGQVSETIEVDSTKKNILRILGLLHHNAVVDQQIYNSSHNMISARVRSYSSAADAIVGGGAGLENTWNIAVEYNGSKVTKFTVVEV